MYLVFPQHDLAAIVQRLYDRQATAVDAGYTREDGGRHPQVARALVGPRAALGIDLALACQQWGVSGILGLGPSPGQVKPGHRLSEISPEALDAFTERWLWQDDSPARRPEDLCRLVASVLREPGKPISALLPVDRLSGPAAVQGDYLRGLRDTAGVLLRDLDCGWTPSFSTYEPPPGGVATQLPHIVFRDRAGQRGAPPTQLREETMLVLCDDADPPYRDECDLVAVRLVAAYDELGGTGLAAILDPIVRHDSLRARLEAAATHPGLVKYDHVGTRSAPRAERRTAAARPTHRPPGSRLRYPPERPATVATPDSRSLFSLYEELEAQRGRENFFELVDWICAAASRGVMLSQADAEIVMNHLAHYQWYAPELAKRGGNRAAIRLAGLLYPLFGEQLADDRLLNRLHDLLARPLAPHIWAGALTVLYAQLANPGHAERLEQHLVPALLNRARASRETQSHAGHARRWPAASSPIWRQRVPVPIWALATAALAMLVMLMVLGWR
ncbi:hypothetical protein [Sphaerisporangium corydalis]|uniref:DUF4192 domain-containing protein n=1 Tax=Sphaerisporangium corydalis TaxID=1441875 RepID=A0ABV9ETB2_9ACTN|nr:hypothetical protein [Sphaerisporangium corydalis]